MPGDKTSHPLPVRNILVPAFIAAATAAATGIFQTATLLHQEGIGLFLNTPDYYRSLLNDPLPLSNLIGDFIVQFYSDYRIGIAIVTVMVTAVYFIFSGIFGRLGLHGAALPSLCGCTAWWFIANADGPATGAAVILISGAVLAVLSLFRKVLPAQAVSRKKTAGPSSGTQQSGKSRHSIPGWADTAISLLIPALTVVLIGTDTGIRQTEKWSRIEYAAVYGKWDHLLKYATRKEAEKDLEVVPWAFLALNVQGRLEGSIDDYPTTPDFGLDYGEITSNRSPLFYALLYSHLGCHNEAIHRIHQSGIILRHGTSFRTLRMLIEENYAIKDSLMVVKYCDILSHSTLHGDFVKHFRENPCRQRHYWSAAITEGEEEQLITIKNQIGMLYQLYRAGLNSDMAEERYRCYMFLKEKYENSGLPAEKEPADVN